VHLNTTNPPNVAKEIPKRKPKGEPKKGATTTSNPHEHREGASLTRIKIRD